MENKRILTVQDISCVGQCSLTVALPILSACGIETCVLPSAVLSTHTGGFKGYTFRDLTEDIPPIRKHWEAEKIVFDAVYTGYLGSTKQIDYVRDIFNSTVASGAKKIVDPAMADNGKLYYGFDQNFADAMAALCADADVILPNITEACFMTGIEYKESYDEKYIETLFKAMADKGIKDVILTGVGFEKGFTGVMVKTGGKVEYYRHKRLDVSSHGTGDVYASAFCGALLRGYSEYDSAKIAADFTVECIKSTEKEHWYGVRFEPTLPKLIEKLK
ncbi:MAG: pyridoxamine kinase [Clostridia bacterium]|nr:pyridoxamine kinase [Clostridia bacterium]